MAADSGQARRRLLDADIEWMGPENFALQRLHLTAAYRAVPAVMYHGGGLCMFRRPREPEAGERRSSFERAMRG